MKKINSVVKDPLTERLACLSEELGESVQALGKTMRHGLDSSWNDGPTNRQWLARELGQVTAMTKLMIDAGDIDQNDVERGEIDKYKAVQPYLHTVDNRKLALERVKQYRDLLRKEPSKRWSLKDVDSNIYDRAEDTAKADHLHATDDDIRRLAEAWQRAYEDWATDMDELDAEAPE